MFSFLAAWFSILTNIWATGLPDASHVFLCHFKSGCASPRYAEPTFEEEKEVIDGDYSGSMYGLVDNDKEASGKVVAGSSKLDKALAKVRKELDRQLARAGVDDSLSSEVDAALSQFSGLASRLVSSAKELTEPASA